MVSKYSRVAQRKSNNEGLKERRQSKDSLAPPPHLHSTFARSSKRGCTTAAHHTHTETQTPDKIFGEAIVFLYCCAWLDQLPFFSLLEIVYSLQSKVFETE